MIDNLTLRNFKSFSKLEGIKFKPVTIMCGTNSCGKSTILQSILLLKQTFESQNPNQTLLLNGRLVHLGSFENIIFENVRDRRVDFELAFSLDRQDTSRLRKRASSSLNFILRDLIPSSVLSDKEARFSFEVKFWLKSKQGRPLESDEKQIVVDRLAVRIESYSKLDQRPPILFDMTHIEENRYRLKWENFFSRFKRPITEKNVSGEREVIIRFANLFPASVAFAQETEEDPLDVTYSIYHFTDIFQALLSAVTYLGPLREEPSRRYIYENEVVEIGNKGENAAYLYLLDRDRPVLNHYYYDRESDGFVSVQKMSVNEAVERWLAYMGIMHLKAEPTSELIYLRLNSTVTANTRVNIADVGFGVSQIFPIVLEGIRMPKRHSLLLEQPEIHLHPNLQMQLADYFIALALSEKNVIVETHSDHIVNRLVRRIVEDKSNELAKLISIYFVKASEGGSIYEEIMIEPDRGIVNWPQDFFDQTASEQQKILRAGLEKRAPK